MKWSFSLSQCRAHVPSQFAAERRSIRCSESIRQARQLWIGDPDPQFVRGPEGPEEVGPRRRFESRGAIQPMYQDLFEFLLVEMLTALDRAALIKRLNDVRKQ